MKKKGTTIEKVKTKRMKRSSNSNKQSMAKKKLNTMKTSHESNNQELMVQNEKLKQDVVKEKAISQQNCDILVLQVSGLEMKVGFAEHDLSKANTERDNAIKDHRKNNMELSGQISVVRNRVVTLEDNLATMGAEKEGLAKEKEQLRVELEAKEKEYNTTVASNDKAHALKEKEFKKVCAEKEELTSAKEQLEDELKVNEEKYTTAVASHENELTAKDEEVTQLQVVVAQLQLEKQKLAAVKEEQQEEANEHTGDTYGEDGNLTGKVLMWGPNNRYPPKPPFCKRCKKRGCRGKKFAECGKVKYCCAGGCGCQTYGSEDAFWLHVMGNGHQKGCLPYARKFSNHIAACEVKGINNYQTFRLKKNEEDDQEDSVKEWLDAL